MANSANGLDHPWIGEVWETRNGVEWTSPQPDSIEEEAPTLDARHAGQDEGDFGSSYFHVRWLGEAE